MNILLVIILAAALLLTGLFSRGDNLDHRLSKIVEPYRFSIVGWEAGALWQSVTRRPPEVPAESGNGTALVYEFFNASKRLRQLENQIAVEGAPASLQAEYDGLVARREVIRGGVEHIIGGQIRQVLEEEGIYNPFTGRGFDFPPLNFTLAQLPDVLVISPRDRIDSIDERVLDPGLTAAEKEDIESRADSLGVSSLVVDIGGIATYPSLVDEKSGLRFAIDTITEEWTHQYLAFKPLGFRYVLDLAGISRNYEIATMNESLAGMVSEEIGSLVMQKFYPGSPDTSATKETYFDRRMRKIRKNVDAYLARGEIEQAEAYMEQSRLSLLAQGYSLRKLNQAYFAFHGAYAHSPGYISPIGQELKELRGRSGSLKEFLDAASALTGRQELSDAAR